MIGTLIHLQLTVHVATQRVLRQHALDRGLDHTLWRLGDQLLEVDRLDATRETGVRVVHLVGGFRTGNTHLLGIDNDDVIASIDVRGVFRLVLATQAASDFGCQTTQGLAGSVDDEPVALDGFRFSSKSLHSL